MRIRPLPSLNPGADSESRFRALELAVRVASQNFEEIGNIGVEPRDVNDDLRDAVETVLQRSDPDRLLTNTHNWNLDTQKSIFYADALAAVQITGIANGTPNKAIAIVNQGSTTITLKHEDAESSPANRFKFSSGADVTIGSDRSVHLVYDEKIQRWRDTHVVSAVSAALSAEISNRISADNALSQKISVLSQQASVLSQAASVLSQGLSVEAAARAAKDDALSQAVSVLSQAHSVLSQAVSVADAALSVRVDTQSQLLSALSQAHSVLSQALSNEISNRQSAVNVVSTAASNALSVANAASQAASVVSQALSNEISNRTSAVNAVSQAHSVLSQVVSVLSQALSDEISNRNSAVNAVSNAASNALSVANAASQAASVVSQALSNEISNRISADNALSDKLSVHSQQISVLSQGLSVLSQALSNEISNRASADNALSNAISGNTSAISQLNSVVSQGLSLLSNKVSVVSQALSVEIVQREVLSTMVIGAIDQASNALSVAVNTQSIVSQGFSVFSHKFSVQSQNLSLISNTLSNEIANRADQASVMSTAISQLNSVVSQGLSLNSQRHSAVSQHLSVLSQQISALSQAVSALSAGAAGGINNLSVQNVDAVALSAGMIVYAFTSAETVKRGTHLEGDPSGQVLGMVIDAAIAVSAVGRIQTFGTVTLTTAQWDARTGGSGGLTPGSYYYQDGTGNITATAPGGTRRVRPIGIAISTTKLQLLVQTMDDPTSTLSALSQNVSVLSQALSVHSQQLSVLSQKVSVLSSRIQARSLSVPQSVTTSALADVVGLSAILSAGESYKIEVGILFGTSAAGNVFGFGMSVRNAEMAGIESWALLAVGALAAAPAPTYHTASSLSAGATALISATAATSVGGGGRYLVRMEGVIKMNTSAGVTTEQLQIMAEGSPTNVHLAILQGSYIKVEKVS